MQSGYNSSHICMKSDRTKVLGPFGHHEAYPYAAEAAELGAVGAETSIPQFLHANETAEHLGNALQRDRLL